MRIIFMGSPDFALPSLEKIYQSNHQLISVVSNKDKRRGRGGKKSPTPVKAWAEEHDIPVITVEQLDNAAFTEQIRSFQPDLLVVVAFRILPKVILEIPRKGAINLHASLLPRYRGAAPIHWAVINGESKTGCSVFFLDEQVDTGAIIKQREAEIACNETTGDVYNRLKTMGAELLMEAVEEIAGGNYQTRPQDDTLATPAPKLFKEDCLINVTKTAEEVHNKIRGLSPFPTAFLMLDGKKFNIYRSQIGPDIPLKTGALTINGEKLLLGCGRGTVALIDVQLEGRKRMSGPDFINGYNGPMEVDRKSS